MAGYRGFLTVSSALGVLLVACVGQAGQHSNPGAATLRAYQVLMNDMKLVADGKLGISRIPRDPRNGHPKLLEVYRHSSQNTLARELNQLVDAGYSVEHGLLAPPKKGLILANPFFLWDGIGKQQQKLFGFQAMARPSKNPKLAMFASKVADSAAKNGTPFVYKSWTVEALPIRYETRACLKCHKQAKVGDLAALAAVAYRKAD